MPAKRITGGLFEFVDKTPHYGGLSKEEEQKIELDYEKAKKRIRRENIINAFINWLPFLMAVAFLLAILFIVILVSPR